MGWSKQQAVGDVFEQLIILANDRYRRERRGVIWKVPTAWKPIRDRTGKICSAKVTEKAPVDFIGVFDGRPIAFEAKHTENKTWMGWDRLESHQEEFLLDWERAGGEAFVLIGRKLDVLKVPIGKWRSGGKSILLHGHPEWFVPMRGGLPDYMAAEKEEPQDYRARRDRDGPQRV